MVRVVVSGQVQGVGFRAYVRDAANQLGIVGEVWNRPDGSVELFAYHTDQTQLDLLVSAIREGPGRVDNVIVENSNSDEEFGEFRIVWNR